MTKTIFQRSILATIFFSGTLLIGMFAFIPDWKINFDSTTTHDDALIEPNIILQSALAAKPGKDVVIFTCNPTSIPIPTHYFGKKLLKGDLKSMNPFYRITEL